MLLILNALFYPASAARKSSVAGIGYLAFYLGIAILLAMVFNRAVFERPDGIYTGVMNNLGDLPLHLQVINSFAQGHNLPPEDPTFAGVRFAYPFLVDFLAAMLVRAGAGVIFAMWLQNMVMALALVGLLHYWTVLLTRNRLAGVIAPLLVLFSGGLGWWLLFSEGSSDGLFAMLGNLQHDYTIVPEQHSALGKLSNDFVCAAAQHSFWHAAGDHYLLPMVACDITAGRRSAFRRPSQLPHRRLNKKPPLVQKLRNPAAKRYRQGRKHSRNLSRPIFIFDACWLPESAPDCCLLSMPTRS